MSDSKVILVTGATDGIGRETALELAKQGHTVLVHGRNERKVKEVVDAAKAAGARDAQGFVADFASFDSVRALASEVHKRVPHLNVLVNNAGVMMPSRKTTADGHEMTWQVNHLSPFLLTNLLLPLLEKSAPARIVNVSSTTHQSGEINFDDLEGERGYSGYSAYSNSKLANVLFTKELATRLRDRGITANALHPGVIATKLLHAGFGGMGGSSPKEGARTSVMLATSGDVEGVTGKYFANGRESSASSLANDEALRRRLWEVSAEATGLR